LEPANHSFFVVHERKRAWLRRIDPIRLPFSPFDPFQYLSSVRRICLSNRITSHGPDVSSNALGSLPPNGFTFQGFNFLLFFLNLSKFCLPACNESRVNLREVKDFLYFRMRWDRAR
jgi:hypothetical protein